MTVNAHVKSAAVAVKVIKKLTPFSISPSHLIDLTATIGEELAQERDRQAAQQVEGTLEPEVKQPPETAGIGTDGGRIFTRAQEAGRGVHDPAWKETKIARLTTFHSQPSDTDPHPELPGCFADQEGVGKLVREIKSIRNQTGGRAAIDDQAESEEAATQASDLLESLVLPAEPADTDPPGSQPTAAKTTTKTKNSPKSKKQDWRPQRRVRTCVSSMCSSDEFGPKVAAEARRRGFFQALRRAFLGDGLPWNWTLHARWFPDFEPILDFIHPTTYVYEASRVVTYLSNNAARMDYPRYRRMGLPVTSSMVESLIKEFNYRVKGSEKAWKRPSGCEAILQVRGRGVM